ncbi:MAG: RDD family protein, partial [Saprospiraceae bacterium]|nr:RDD family protein [Saprospiraceae bacterium]
MVEKSYFVSANVVARKEARFFNFVVDYISIFLILVLISILNMVFFLDIDSEVVDSSIIPEGNTLAEYIIFSLLSISYYFVLEVLTGRTIGKWLTGSIVVDISGNKPPTST